MTRHQSLIFALILLAGLIAGCGRKHLNDAATAPQSPTVALKTVTEVGTGGRLAGFSLQVPEGWEGEEIMGGYLFRVPQGAGSSLVVERTLGTGTPEQASQKKAESQRKIGAAVSGKPNCQEGVFKGQSGVVRWLRFPEGGGGSNLNVTEYYFPADSQHHYLLSAKLASNSEQDLEAICDYAAATAKFEGGTEP